MPPAVTFTTPVAVAVAGVPKATACPHSTAGPVASLGHQPRWCQALGQRWAGLGGSETPQEHPRKRRENRWCPSRSRSGLGDKTNPSLSPPPLFTPLSRTSQHLAHLEVGRCCRGRDLSLQRAAAAPP